MAAALVLAGFVFIGLSVTSIVGGAPVLDWALPMAGGAIVLVVGLVLFVTDLLENWLSKGQSALVDGLQAG